MKSHSLFLLAIISSVTALQAGLHTETIENHADKVAALGFSPDSAYIVTTSANNARISNVYTGKSIANFNCTYKLQGSCVALNPTTRLVLVGHNKTALLWQLETGAIIKEFNFPVEDDHHAIMTATCLSADGQYALLGFDDNTARLLELKTGQTILLKGHTGGRLYTGVTATALSDNNKYALTGAHDATARLWNLQQREIKLEKIFTGHSLRITSVALSKDNTLAVTGSDDKTARVWDITTGKTLYILKGHTGIVTTVAISSDNKYIATGSWDKTVRLWDAATGQLVSVFTGHNNSITSVAFSPDGNSLVTGSEDKTARIYALI